MTAICASSGPSQPKSLTSPVIALTTTVMEAIVAASGQEELLPFVPILGGLTAVQASVLCGSDPPSLPTFVGQDFIDVINFGDVKAQQAALLKFNDWLLYYEWFIACECVTGAQPTQTTPPALPSPLPDPTTVTTTPGAGGTPCQIVTQGTAFTINDNASHQIGLRSGGGNGPNAIPAGATSIVWALDSQSNGTSLGPHVVWTITFYASDQTTVLASYTFPANVPNAPGHNDWWANAGSSTPTSVPYPALVNGLPEGAPTVTTPVPAGAAWYNGFIIESVASTSVSVFWNAAIYCGGSTPGSSGCCPPDPTVLTALVQIQAQLAAILGSQPSLGVRSYASGAAHAGLSGAGPLSFTDSPLGVRVNLTTVPGAAGQVFGDPVYYANAGWINLVTTEGTLAGVRVEYDGQFIPFAGLVSSLTYSLAAGFVATITEVTAGP